MWRIVEKRVGFFCWTLFVEGVTTTTMTRGDVVVDVPEREVSGMGANFIVIVVVVVVVVVVVAVFCLGSLIPDVVGSSACEVCRFVGLSESIWLSVGSRLGFQRP